MLRKNEYAHAASPSLAKTKFAHIVVKNRASHSLAKTGGVLLVRVLRQVKPYIFIYIYIYIYTFVPRHPFCTDFYILLRHNATVEIRRIHWRSGLRELRPPPGQQIFRATDDDITDRLFLCMLRKNEHAHGVA